MRKRCKQENRHSATLPLNATPIPSNEVPNAARKRGPPAFPADLSRRPKKKTATDNYSVKAVNNRSVWVSNAGGGVGAGGNNTVAPRRKRHWRETGVVPNSDSEDDGWT